MVSYDLKIKIMQAVEAGMTTSKKIFNNNVCSLSTFYRAIKEMEREGLVRKVAVDGRINKLGLTEKGKKILEVI